MVALTWSICPLYAQSPAGDPSGVRASLDGAAGWLHAGDARKALELLASVEEAEPDNPWLWFYRGSAHLRLNDAYEAMAAFDRASEVLIGLGGPDPDLAERIARQRRIARRRVFGLRFQTGFAYDSNVSYLGSDASTLDLIAGEEDGRFVTSLQADFAPVDDGVNLLAVGLRTSHSWHFRIDSFDFQDYGAYVRYARHVGDSLELGVRYDYDVALLGNDRFLSRHALTPSIRFDWRASPSRFHPSDTTVYYRLEARDFLFETEPAFDRDGLVHAVGVEQGFRLRPIADWPWWWTVAVGYRYDREHTDGTEFDRRGHAVHVDLSMPLVNPAAPTWYLVFPDKELVLRIHAGWQGDKYANASLIDVRGRERRDRTTTVGAVLSQTLIDHPDSGTLVLHLIGNWTDAESNVRASSNISPFTYDKFVFAIQIEWSW